MCIERASVCYFWPAVVHVHWPLMQCSFTPVSYSRPNWAPARTHLFPYVTRHSPHHNAQVTAHNTAWITTSRSRAQPRATCMMQIFGHPTGLGALLVRRDTAGPLLAAGKKYFGGGTVAVSIADAPYMRRCAVQASSMHLRLHHGIFGWA